MPLPVIMNDRVPVHEFFSSFQGEGMLAGYRQMFIRLYDCNLNCNYCDTATTASDAWRLETSPGSGSFTTIPLPASIEQLVGIAETWTTRFPGVHHSISITGGEPLLHGETLSLLLPRLREFIPVHLETNGTMHMALEQIICYLDFISMDMKLPSTAGCTDNLWEIHRIFLQGSTATTVSVKVVAGEDTQDHEIQTVCDIIRSVRPGVPLFIQPLTRRDGSLGISPGRLFALHALAAGCLPDVRVMPQMHLLLNVL